MRKWILIAVTAALATIGGWLYAHGKLELPKTASAWLGEKVKPKAQSASAPLVSVVRVAPAEFTETIQVVGSLVAREEILVAPEISGQPVTDILADIGDRVEAGQTLARLGMTSLDAQLAQNTASRARAVAARAQAESLIAQTQAQKTEADAALARAGKLRAKRNLAQSVYDQRLSAARTAAAQQRSAHDGLKVADAEIALADARRRELLWQRGRGAITAPASGIVSKRTGQIGAMAAAAPMFYIIRDGEIELSGELPAAALARIKTGQDAQIATVDGIRLTGKVRLISPQVDTATRLGRVRIHLGDDRRLRIGTFARGRIQTAKSSGLSIPASAVMYNGGKAYVLVARNDVARRRMIAVGLQTDGRAEILSGLTSGEVVVAKAGTFLRDGDPIKPVLTRKTRLSAYR